MAGEMEVDQSWIFDSKLGSGGFGVVQLWRNIHTGEEIAIKKCLSTEAQLSERQRERWKSEVAIMKELQHPNIIATKPVPKEVENIGSSLPVLCMEYCRQGDLRRVLSNSENWCGLPEPDVIQIMANIAGAVQYLHSRQITHRDLKPENVVRQLSNGKIIYKLIDLGYAKSLGQDSMCASIVGTMNYVAPELLWHKKYSCSVDYWSLGILFYEIITGSRPFLPNESNPVIWKNHIENKSYEDICAEYVNGSLVFHQSIQEPNDMTQCIKDALVDWFRIVLQWNPRKRGRTGQNNGIADVVVFKMLSQILLKKVVRVFCVSRYRMYDYAVSSDTTLRVLQSWIEKDTQIAISSQELINSSGAVLKDNDRLQDRFLTLFRKQDVRVEYSEPELPAIVEKMIEMPKVQMHKHELRQCYSAGMFFVKKEVELFRCYILALSTKIDLIISRFDTLLMKNEKVTSGINSMKSEFDSMIELMNSDVPNIEDNWQTEIRTLKRKIDSLSESTSVLKVKCDQFSRICKTLTEFGDVDWMTRYERFLNDAQNIVESIRDLTPRDTRQPIRMAKLIVKMLESRRQNNDIKKVEEISSKIDQIVKTQVTEDLSKQETCVESAIAMISIYRQKISNLRKTWLNDKQTARINFSAEKMDIECSDNVNSVSSSTPSTIEASVTPSDNVIYDNLKLRYMIDDVMHETEKVLQIMNLDS